MSARGRLRPPLPRLLLRASLRDLLRHRWQTLLAALGVALGVAVVAAVDIANESARRAFELSVERVAGRATHSIESATGRIADAAFADLAPSLAGLDASPVLEATVRIGASTFTLLGVDPLAFARLNPAGATVVGPSLGDLIALPRTVLLGAADARRLGLEPGDPVPLAGGAGTLEARLIGIVDGGQGPGLEGLALADIAAAQELTGRIGWIDRVDLVLAEADAAALAGRLPEGLRLVPAAQRGEALRQMTRAFRINLTAMSLLAVLVGAFIVYNAMTFAVLRRRGLLGSLRTLGCTRGQLFLLVMGEALALSLLASLAGLALGILTGWGLVQLVVRTIDDLYFTLTVGALALSPRSLLAGLGLGVLVTLAATLGPALEAARAEPRDVLRSGHLERRGGRWIRGLAAGGAALFASGLVLARIESQSIGLGFLAVLLVVLGFSLGVPALLRVMARALAALAGRSRTRTSGGLAAVLAARGIGTSIARTGIAVAALTVAVSASVGVGIMIDSFRGSLVQWLETTLQSDLYVSAPDASGERPGGRLPPGLAERAAALPGVQTLSQGQRARVATRTGEVALLALQSSSRSTRGFRLQEDSAPDLWPRFDRGELILVSEPFAYRQQVGVGERIELFTPRGWRPFEVGAVFRDYGSDRGTLVMARDTYARLWDDPSVSTLGLILAPDADPRGLRERLRELAEASGETLLVTANGEIREQSIAIFDRTFAITRVLRLLALGVAFVGVLSALLALELERGREHAILRATGMTRLGVGTLVLVQTSILGLAAGLFALPLGLLMGDLLIEVVNVRSFGWTMELRVPPAALGGGLLLAWIAALLAGLYPALKAARADPADALRSE